jgi:M6 family metalloprotease-like protein
MATTAAYAVPAYPGLTQYKLPDGSFVQVQLSGDEHAHQISTPDGYTLLSDTSGKLFFANMSADGSLIASDIPYIGSSDTAKARGIAPGLKERKGVTKSFSKDAAKEALQVDVSFPPTGHRKLLMILVNFSDTQTTYTKEDFENMMNQENYNGIGSFRDFYLENSYGNLDIETTVTEWVQLPYPKNYYGADGAQKLISDAITMLASTVDFSQFDNNGDGILDGLSVIHQGGGQEYTGSGYDIWSHSSEIYGLSVNGITVRTYTIEPEVLGYTGRQSTMGVICHEFGHNIGAPDFYDTDYSSNGSYGGTGTWDLMGSGAWNGDYGDRPANINMWQKIQYGWVEPTLLDSTTTVTAMKPANEEPVAYRINSGVPGEYFIIENRQQKGSYDSALPGHGLLMYHADESLINATVAFNTLNATYPQAMYTLCAGAGCDPAEGDPNSYGDTNATYAPFPGTRNITSISDSTLPSLKSRSGRHSYKALNAISESEDGDISFNFDVEASPEAPYNLEATASRGVVKLSWQYDGNMSDLKHFTIYRNNVAIDTTRELSYTDNAITSQTDLEYFVDATYNSGLVSPYETVSLTIPANFAQDLTLSSEIDATQGVLIKALWSADTRLSRMKNMEQADIYGYETSSIDYVHRFTAADLAIYRGYTIRKIGFFPYLGPKALSYTLRVWEADEDGSNPKILSERKISEFGASTWNDLLLTKTVKIADQKQLWLGVHVECSDGTIQVINDLTGDGLGLGDWVKIGDTDTWHADSNITGNYYLRFTLVEPAVTEPTDLYPDDGTFDPTLDLFYPLGYAIYRDNELIGTSGNRIYIDKNPAAGKHTYSVGSLYKGGNESVSISADIEAPSSAVATLADANSRILCDNGVVTLPDYQGSVEVYSISGTIVYRNNMYGDNNAIILPQGCYIVKTADSRAKILVK